MNNKIQTGISKQDEKDINDSIEEAKVNPLPEDDKAVAVRDTAERSLAKSDFGINIEGLQDVSASMIAVPFVRLVQPTSTKVELEDGTDAPVGSYYFNDIQQAFNDLSFVILRVKQVVTDFERETNGVKTVTPTPQLKVLGVTLDKNKLFVLSLSRTSFSPFGRLIAKFKDLKISKVWEYEVTASSEKRENDKGKYWVADFQVGEKLTDEQLSQMSNIYGEYGGVLDREDLQEDDA